MRMDFDFDGTIHLITSHRITSHRIASHLMYLK